MFAKQKVFVFKAGLLLVVVVVVQFLVMNLFIGLPMFRFEAQLQVIHPQKTIDKLLHQLYQLLNPPASASTKRQKNPMESSSSSSRCAALRAWWEETTDTRLLSSPWICRPAGTSLRVATMLCNILIWVIRVTWQMDPWFFGQGVKKKESRSQGREKDNKKLGEKKQVDQSWTDCFEVNELKKIFF